MTHFIEPPRLRIGEDSEQERHASWLELFYDLVFVVAISQLAHNLEEDYSTFGLFKFMILFIPVWWSWIGATMYANRFDSDDIIHRLLTGLQILTAAALAVNIHHGLGESSRGFAISYALGRLVLVVEYIRAGKHIPVARPLTNRYSVGFAIAAILWLISAFVPTPWRFALWGAGLLIDVATPFTATKYQLQLLPHAAHLPERFGLFTIIVLGEAIIAVVNGVSEQRWDALTVISAIFGLGIAFCIWWVYFDNLGGTPIVKARKQGKVGAMAIWLYTHLPLVIGIAAAGVGVEKILMSKQTVALPDSERWLICSAVSLCWLTIGILHRLGVIRYCKIRFKYRIGAAATVLAIAFFGKGLLPVAVIGLITLVSAIQIVQDLSGVRPTTRLTDAGI
jgi:low temperature requirement protein LtrA